MKNQLLRLLSTFFLTATFFTGFSQVRVTDLPTLTDNPSGGWILINKNGKSSKVDAANFVSNGGARRISDYFNNVVDSTDRSTHRLGDVIYGLIDDYTGEMTSFKKVANPSGIVIDSVLFWPKGPEVFKRVLVNNRLNPQWYGLVGDGITENGSKVQQMMLKIKKYSGGYHLVYPAAKTFLQSVPWGNPGDHFTIEGEDKWTSVIKSNAPTPQSNGVYSYAVMFGLDYGISNGCTIRNIRFETFDNARVVVAGGQVKNLVVDGCTSNAPLIDLQSGSYAKRLTINQYGNLDPYDSTTEENLNRNIRITNNILENYRDIGRGRGAIAIGYTDGAVVSGNIISGYNQGIQYWGGDAAGYQGTYPSKKWATHITITGNKVNAIWGGGIWGSNGENITIGNNTISNCGDVGADVEGSSRVAISGNVIEYCNNGGITTFFNCSAINISGNTVTSDVNGSYLFEIYNAFQTFVNLDITVTGNTFNNFGTGTSYVGGDNANSFIFSSNTLINTRINATGNNFKTIELNDNKIRLYNVLPDSSIVINVRGYHTNARAYINNNTVLSLVTQPAGVVGINVLDDDYNTSNKAWIRSNNISGISRAIVVRAESTNTDIVSEFYLDKNVLGIGGFERYERLGRSRVLLTGNMDGLGRPYPAAIPGTGKWDIGQKIEYLLPTAAGFTGAVYLASGVWKEIGGGVTDTTKPPPITINGQPVTSNVVLTTDAVPSVVNKRYVTDAQLTAVSGTSGTNTGDETAATIKSKLGYVPLPTPASIIAGTATKVTYDANGLIKSIAPLLASDIPPLTAYTPVIRRVANKQLTQDIQLTYDDLTTNGTAGMLKSTPQGVDLAQDNADFASPPVVDMHIKAALDSSIKPSYISNGNGYKIAKVLNDSVTFFKGLAIKPNSPLTLDSITDPTSLILGFTGSSGSTTSSPVVVKQTIIASDTNAVSGGAVYTALNYKFDSTGGKVTGDLVINPGNFTVGNNAADPQYRMYIHNALSTVAQFSSASSSGGLIKMFPYTDPTAANTPLFRLAWGSRTQLSAVIVPYSTGAFSSTSTPVGLSFQTTPIGSVTPVERMRLNEDTSSFTTPLKVQPPPLTDSTNTLFTSAQVKQLIKAAGGGGFYALQGGSSSVNFAANTSYYIGSIPGYQTLSGGTKIPIPKNATLTSIQFFSTTAGGAQGSSEVCTFYARVSGAETLLGTGQVGFAQTSSLEFNNLNIPVSKSQYFELKVATPATYATLPTSVRMSYVLSFTY